MKNDEIYTELEKISVKDLSWMDDENLNKDNEDWLDFSFKIAVKVLSELRLKGISQNSFADLMGCSSQYISKLLKGKENLTIQTIFKIQKVLGLQLISTFDFEYQDTISTNEVTLIPQTFVRMPDYGSISFPLQSGGFRNGNYAA
ncbi:helix-turn-helix transcriptional regulator [Aquirufa ecclesiirivi]|uniref:helix-turn-helix transcriptional regulator n=1 Tax=Aquirufa ecclesiirivi TaxID=2715124 RepID=UPI00140B8843|nr:helix-turn-helix transcriptional regulator [Aquirufa ecclesiirivi]NHC49184.1 helix-turn-helix transcriptional regulator [Aquirufa ecclesiirivi]